MSHTAYTFNRYHLGDNLIFLHLLRALAKQRVSQPFVHFCHAHLIPQLQEAAADLPNILLEPFESRLWEDRGPEAVDTWKNAEGYWEASALRWDWSGFQLCHHAWMANRLGFESPFTCREHLLFDYPALGLETTITPYDFLVVNSEPSSGQFGPMKQHGSGYLSELIFALMKRGFRVAYTQPLGSDREYEFPGLRTSNALMSISDIGKFSRIFRHHIMVATGPMWPTLNTHNHHHHEGRRRIVLLDNGENLNMPFIDQRESVEQIFDIAGEEGWL